mgnify:CR=1 FL=1
MAEENKMDNEELQKEEPVTDTEEITEDTEEVTELSLIHISEPTRPY